MNVLANKQHKAVQGIQAAGCFGIPELKNPRYLDCFKAGRKAHFKAALALPEGSGTEHLAIPLHSHHQTRQSLFTKGWQSVTELDRLRARARLAQSQPQFPQPQYKEAHHG